ncbi:MAG: aldo/keto reductase [Chloroflexota bacterium]|nr:aldo/keto reductase [Chloroflexota bacterium]
MKQQQVGDSEVKISGIGLGCVTFGREIDEESSRKVLDYAVEKGITFLDTAEGYGGGQSRVGRKQSLGIDDEREVSSEMSSSERIIGDWMRDRGCREEVTIFSKVSSGASPENINKQINASLERLQIDRLDIYKVHSPDSSVPISETMDALDKEVRLGKTRVVGGSNYSTEQIKESLNASIAGGYARFQIMQPPYSIAAPDAAKDIFPLCHQEKIAITPYSPLAAGFLSGKYTADRSDIPKGTRYDISPSHADIYFSDRNFRIVDLLKSKAVELGIPIVQLAMAWAMTNNHVTAVIAGARTTKHVDNALLAYQDGMDETLRTEISDWS